jgi:hypothetical protein
VVSIQDSLGGFTNLSQTVGIDNSSVDALNATQLLDKLRALSGSGDYLSEIYLINLLAHYLPNDMHSLELKRLVLQEGVFLR